MADEEIVNESEKKVKPASGGKSPIVTVLLMVNAIALGAVAFFQFQAHQKEASRPTLDDIAKAAAVKVSEGETGDEENREGDTDGMLLPLDGFTANLAQGDGPRRYVRLNAVLKFDKTSKEEEFKARKPQIRDSIIGILNSKRAEDLLKTEGKSYLKEEIKAAINSFLVDGQVIDVFYVGFQIN